MKENLDSFSDERLAKMAQGGSRPAFEALCDRTLPTIYNRLRAVLPPEAVEDVTQEVFIAAIKGIKRYRARSSFRTWIHGIARHKVADYYRRRNRRPETTVLDGERNDPTANDNWEERAMVRVALLRLPVHYQEMLLLRFAEGLPFDAIARTLSISLEAAKSRYRRAVAAIAQEMGMESSYGQ
jgi:RNA polymerase sigma-70 factor (ECF subfamily)